MELEKFQARENNGLPAAAKPGKIALRTLLPGYSVDICLSFRYSGKTRLGDGPEEL